MRPALHVCISRKINSKRSKLFIRYWNALLNGDIIFSSSDICVDSDTTNISYQEYSNKEMRG